MPITKKTCQAKGCKKKFLATERGRFCSANCRVNEFRRVKREQKQLELDLNTGDDNVDA